VKRDYPEQLLVEPVRGPVRAVVTVPPSKSISNRALVLAALASRWGECRLEGVLTSEDTEVMVQGLQRLGFGLQVGWEQQGVRVSRPSSLQWWIPAESADLWVGNSGTTMRFLCAVLSLGHGRYRLDGVPRMRQRPIGDLLAALNQLEGVCAWSEAGSECPPVVVEAQGVRVVAPVRVRAQTSSQFLSGLLLAAPYWSSPQGEVEIVVCGPRVSEPYVNMTVAMMRQWGHRVEQTEQGFVVKAGGAHCYRPDYVIEPDATAASYFWAAAAITGGQVTVRGLNDDSLQGDVGFVELLAQMGCRVERCAEGISVHGGRLRGITADMNAISDTVMTLAAVACFAEGPTRIHHVGHIRHKETDRIAALSTELRKLGVEVEEAADGLTIYPRPMHAAVLKTYDDHRMAMSLALVGLRVQGVVIDQPGCVAKTYPGFWEDWQRLRETSMS
jgi:3-phosphoshikimate 1-carboxyvinyltransferase